MRTRRGRVGGLLALSLAILVSPPSAAAEAAARTATGRKAMVATASPLATAVTIRRVMASRSMRRAECTDATTTSRRARRSGS